MYAVTIGEKVAISPEFPFTVASVMASTCEDPLFLTPRPVGVVRDVIHNGRSAVVRFSVSDVHPKACFSAEDGSIDFIFAPFELEKV